MKKVCTLFCLVMVILSMASTTVLAAEPEENVIDLGDGFYVVETITRTPLMRSSDTVGGSKSDKVYYGSTLIGTATLYGTFDISGSAARAVMGAPILKGLPTVPATPSPARHTSSITAHRKPSASPFPAPPTAHSIKIPPRSSGPSPQARGEGPLLPPEPPCSRALPPRQL